MKKQIFILILISFTVMSIAQKTNSNRLNAGIYIGGVKAILISPIELPENAKIENGYGFSTGVFLEYPFHRLISINPDIGISFSDSKVKFLEENVDDYWIMQFAFDVSIDFMFQLSNSIMAPYLVFGTKYNYPFQSIKLRKDEFDLKSNYSLGLGFGFEHLLLNKIIIAPEFKFSYGLTNLNKHPNLTDLKFHCISLIINLKGLK